MTIKERIELEAKTYAFGDQNEHRTFLAGAGFYRKAVIEMLEERSYHLSEIGYSKRQDECDYIIKLLKSER